MAHKQFELDERTQVTIYKRKTSRSLRLSIGADGKIRVSIPVWAPYAAGLKFARSRQAWINTQQRPVVQLQQGQAIGKAHHLQFVVSPTATKITSRVKPTGIVITYPPALDVASPEVQRAATAACVRGLRQQAEALLPQRLSELAAEHGFSYAGVSVKQLRSRWGSCDQSGHIVLNLFLMQLPWDCIDYVLLHELTHTKVLRHGPPFWEAMAATLPDVANLRKALRQHQPVLDSPLQQVMA